LVILFSNLLSTFISISEQPLLILLILVGLIIVSAVNSEINAMPFVNDSRLQIVPVVTGLNYPTSMAFLGPNDILVLEKNQGTVRRITNGNMLSEPVLDVNVANKEERGMLGIAITKEENKLGKEPTVYVFLYYTETKSKDGEDLNGGVPLGNRLYRYELVDNKLINPKILLDLPAKPGSVHQGGVMLIGPDKYLYIVVGDVDHNTMSQNQLGGDEPDGTGGIIRITQDGKAVHDNKTLGIVDPLDKYYAYGIRNSFGMDFDPVMGNLWDTENGPDCCDEINLVKPGFNSGWNKVQGIWELIDTRQKLRILNDTLENKKLVNFDGKGKYSPPEFSWNYTVGPTALKFLNSDKLGKQYKNDIFVGNVHHQSLYHFDLTKNRENLSLNGTIIPKEYEDSEDMKGILFGGDFGRVTDIDVGPDGNLYVLSHSLKGNNINFVNGTIYKISKSDN
jgi:glucose/arabinose dehydrogenase